MISPTTPERVGTFAPVTLFSLDAPNRGNYNAGARARLRSTYSPGPGRCPMDPLVLRVLVWTCLTFFPGMAGAADGWPKGAPAPRNDVYGDPLPDGAVARLGSIRLGHAGLSDYVFLDGGRTVLSAGSDRVLRFWDLTTGRQVRAVKLQGTAGPGRCATLSPTGKTLVAHDKEM